MSEKLYYTKGIEVWKSPVKTKVDGGTSFTLGFHACTASEVIGEDGATVIAELLCLGEQTQSPTWRCFHCNEVFYDTHSAKLHFGMDQCSDPACKIKTGAEGSLVKALRTAENELSDAWAAIHNETTEAAKAYYAQQSRHGEQLRAAEEAGYERGLADGRAAHTPAPIGGSTDA